MADCRPVSIPMSPGTHLNASMSPQTPADVEEMKDKPYMRVVGKLNWPALATRPDISYTVSQLARFNSNPGPQHWQAVKRLFRYIQGTIGGAAVAWSSKLQTRIARSTTESEYVAGESATKEIALVT